MLKSVANTAKFFAAHPLTKHAQMQAWRRFLDWQLRSRINDEVVVPWVAGQRLAVRRGMTGATGNIYTGLHDFYGMALHLHFLRPNDLYIDVGANVGTFTVLASGVCRARTWAFEPAPETLPSLRRNISLNDLEGLVAPFDCALGDCERDIFFSSGRGAENHVLAAGEAGSRLVRQRRLDNMIGDEAPHHEGPIMIKIDAEGHEDSVLLGADAVLANPSLKVVTLETTGAIGASLMARHGFEIAYYDPVERALWDAPVVAQPTDALFVRDRPFVQARLSSAEPVSVYGRMI